MATWKLSPQYKKSAIEKMFFYKDGKCIVIEQGYRWATFTVESDERPLTDDELKNEDGYELGCIDNDECWELVDMIDGCWVDITSERENTTEEDVEAFSEAWEEDYFEGVEALGWSNDDTEYLYVGPLELTNEDTGEVFQGEPDDDMPVASKEVMIQAVEELNWEPLPEDEPVVTDWFPASVNPAHPGTYQVLDTEEETKWPFSSNIIAGTWDGEKWDIAVSTTVVKWRGLAKDPNTSK